ncbi:MAG: cell division protein FtsZ [Alphaproteobacteria bacterium]|nr:cell division protein FtsZ [Alphaproteobacteria bacterium]
MINLSMADPEHNLRPRLTVMGVGGAGGNAINNMIRCQLEGCDFIAANTDSQALASSLAHRKIQLGINMSRGLGAGSKPDTGRAAAEEQIADVLACLEGSDMLFITAGMGGGTGTGAAPVIARAAREAGILTVGVVTKPFHFEGNNRMRMAEKGIAELQQYVDTLIVIPNQNLFRIANERTTFAEAFRMADEVLHCGVRGITDLMVMPGFMNLDFADVKTVMGEMGKAMMGTGEADGDNRAIRAAEAAISNPLLDDVSMKGARGVLINITGGMDMTLFEVDQAANRIRDEVDPDAQIKVGSTLGEDLDGRIRVSVIATGIDASLTQSASSGQRQAAPPTVASQLRMVSETRKQEAPVSVQTQQPVAPQGSYFAMPQAVTPEALAEQSKAPTQQTSWEQPAPEAAAYAPQATAPQAAPQSYAPQQPAHTNGWIASASAIQKQEPQSYAPAQQQPAAYTQQPSAASVAQPRSYEPPPAPVRAAPQQQAYQPTPATPPSYAPTDMRVTQLMTPSHVETATPASAASDQRRARRTESLFTRITGFGLVRPSEQHGEEETTGQYTEQTAEAAQPKLGIDPSDRPALSSDQPTDLLDIPAFLRRQTNH